MTHKLWTWDVLAIKCEYHLNPNALMKQLVAAGHKLISFDNRQDCSCEFSGSRTLRCLISRLPSVTFVTIWSYWYRWIGLEMFCQWCMISPFQRLQSKITVPESPNLTKKTLVLISKCNIWRANKQRDIGSHDARKENVYRALGTLQWT